MKNAKMSEYKDDSYTVNYGKGLRVLKDKTNESRAYQEKLGVVYHNLGLVHFDQYKGWPTDNRLSGTHEIKYLNLFLVHNEKKYMRIWEAWYGEKTIARLANEFIEEIKGKE